MPWKTRREGFHESTRCSDNGLPRARCSGCRRVRIARRRHSERTFPKRHSEPLALAERITVPEPVAVAEPLAIAECITIAEPVTVNHQSQATQRFEVVCERSPFRSVIALLTLAASLGGCSTAASYTGGSVCNHVSFSPNVQQLYPSPGSISVLLNVGVLVYASTPNLQSVATSTPSSLSVPISLAIGAAPPITTVPTSVPSPFPSPAASPIGQSPSIFAVTLPSLSPATTYQVLATQTIGGCVQPALVKTEIGTFTTLQASGQ